nr:universal stress protein [Herbiconiux sp. VKM Ac-1786]
METAEAFRDTHPAASISTEVVRGSTIGELLSASSPQSLLVVGGTPGARKPGPFGWSIGARLAAADKPGTVAVIPTDSTTPQREGVVVGYDGSLASSRVLELAFAEALATHQEVRLVHAWTAPLEWQDVYAPDLGLGDSLEALHQGVLHTGVARAGHIPGLAARGSLVYGAPAPAIVDAAQSASEVVIGNHGNHGLRRILLGSVSHAVVRALVAPTIIVRA